MQDSIPAWRLLGSRQACLFTVTALVSGFVVAGCGASSGNSGSASSVASVGSAPTARSSTTTGAATTSSASSSSGGDGSGPLAFSRCMRANGLPNFPDPNPGGTFQFGTGVDPASPGFRAAQSKCRKLLPGGGPPGPGSGTQASAQTMAKLRTIAVCMRQHGVPQFPDPRTSVPSNPAGIAEITDFDGAVLLFPATMNLQAPAYRQALTACGAPPLGLPHR
jgi:hypothetical protein